MSGQKAFDFDAEYGDRYDLFIRQIIPGYEAYFSLCVALLSESVGENGSVLVVGSGTGAEMGVFSALRPGWDLTGVDKSPQMIRLADQRLGAATGLVRPNLRLVLGDVTEVSLDRKFHAVTSNLVMHFIPTKTKKLDYLRALRERLLPGGSLILMDACWEGGSSFQKMMRSWWAFARDQGLKQDRWREFRREFESGLFPLGKDEELRLVREAGFGTCSPFWTSLHHQAIWAIKD